MIKTRSHLMRIFSVVTIMASILLFACGTTDETSIVAPYGSTILINPTEITYGGAAGCGLGTFADSEVFVTVLGPDELPMENIRIYVSLSWAPNSVDPSLQVWQLFDGDTGAPVSVPYTTQTGKSGVKKFIVRVNPDCPFSGVFDAFSGSASGQIDITVS